MAARIWFIFVMLLAIFILVPILNTIIQGWVEPGGVFDTTFNASNPSAWNTTGTILSANQTTHIALTPFESGFTKFYVPLIVIFLVVIIFYVLGKSRSNGEGGE